MSSGPLAIPLGRFARLAQRSQEVWQGGVVSLPVWLGDEDDPEAAPTRPRAVVWVSRRTGLFHVTELEDGDTPTPEAVLRVLLAFAVDEARQLEGRPATIEVTDVALRDALDAALAGLNTTVALVDALPLVQEALRNDEIEQYGVYRPNLLDVPGMTVERMRAFADAAARFVQAQPWGRFPGDELIVVEAPASPPGLQHLAVTGSQGSPIGLAFFASRHEFERLLDAEDADEGDEEAAPDRGQAVTFGPIDTLSFGDADAWAEHALALAGPAAYPFAAEVDADERMRRPAPRELAHIEAVLRALAASDDDEIDRGRWQQRVETADGPVTLTLSLPALLEETAGPSPMTAPADAAAALRRAQQLISESRHAGGRLPITRARQALALSEDCVDAWLTLFDAAASDEQAMALARQAVAAATRLVGANRFEAFAGRFGVRPETRQYLDARFALAEGAQHLERLDEAIESYREVVRLDAEDGLGARYALVSLLLETGRDEDALNLLEAWPDDPHATFAYAQALALFRRAGDTPPAREALTDALRANRHVPSLLLDGNANAGLPSSPGEPGSKDEAVQVWLALVTSWEATPGASDWLRARIPPPARQRGRGARRRR